MSLFPCLKREVCSPNKSDAQDSYYEDHVNKSSHKRLLFEKVQFLDVVQIIGQFLINVLLNPCKMHSGCAASCYKNTLPPKEDNTLVRYFVPNMFRFKSLLQGNLD